MTEDPIKQPLQYDQQVQPNASGGQQNSNSKVLGSIGPRFWEKIFNTAFIVLSCLWAFLFISTFFPFIDLTDGLGYIIEFLFLLQSIYLVAGIILAIKNKAWKWLLKPLIQIIVLFVFYIAGVLLFMGAFG